jgi:hypothetical protein
LTYTTSAVQERDGVSEQLRANLNILNQDLVSLKDKIKDIQYTSNGGRFVWKITNVRKKMGR